MRWISVARDWLIQNAPCTKLTAIQGIATVMPLGVRRDRKVASRTDLACEALYRIYEVKLTDLPDVLEKPPAINTYQTGVTRQIMELASSQEGVLRSQIKPLKNGLSIAGHLVARKILRRDGDRFYRNNGSA